MVGVKIGASPDYISHRIHLFEKLKEEYDNEVACKLQIHMVLDNLLLTDLGYSSAPEDHQRRLA